MLRRLLSRLRPGGWQDEEPIAAEGPIPRHESPVRRILADAHGGTYVAYPTLEEARADPDAALVMEGDDGGQIYVACPLDVVGASEETLRRLLDDLDALAWSTSDPDAAELRFERLPAGSGVAGGMGGGRVLPEIWVHAEFAELGIDEHIRDVVRGHRDRLPSQRRPAT
jgi:hypothetical protein